MSAPPRACPGMSSIPADWPSSGIAPRNRDHAADLWDGAGNGNERTRPRGRSPAAGCGRCRERDGMRRRPEHLVEIVGAIGQPGGQGGRAFQPAAARADGAQAQGRVRPAPVVGQAQQVQPALDERHAVGGRAAPARARGQAFAQRGGEPRAVGRIDGGRSRRGWRPAPRRPSPPSPPFPRRRAAAALPSPRCSPALTTWASAHPVGHTNGGRPGRPVRSGRRTRERAPPTSRATPSTATRTARPASAARSLVRSSRWTSRPSRRRATAVASHRRLPTSRATAAHTTPPRTRTRIASACTGRASTPPTIRSCSRAACVPALCSQARTVRSSRPTAATIAGIGPPWRSNVRTSVMVVTG